MQAAKHRTADAASVQTNAAPFVGRSLATAKLLARKGRYNEAIILIHKECDSQQCSPSESLDLLARIYAQQGRYLEAESCWRQAKHLDGDNPTYDDALSRLRRGHQNSGRFVQIAIMVIAGVLVLLFWQAARVHSERQVAAAASLTAIRGDISVLRDETQEKTNQLGATAGEMHGVLIGLESQLQQQSNALATTVESGRQRGEQLLNMEKRLSALHRELQSSESRQSEQTAKHSEMQSHQLTELKASLLEAHSDLTGVGDTLAAYGKELGRIENSIGSRLQSLPKSADLAALNESMDSKVESLEKYATNLGMQQSNEIEELKASAMELRTSMSAVDAKLKEGIAESSSRDTALHKDIQSIGNHLATIEASVTLLQKQLAEMASAIEREKDKTETDNPPDSVDHGDNSASKDGVKLESR